MQLFPRRQNPLDARNELVDSKLLEPESPDDTPIDRAVKLVYRFKKESEDSAVRKKAVTYWEEADKLIEGEHWDGLSREEWQAKEKINKVFGIHEKSTSLMIESIPELEIVPEDGAHVEIAEVLDNFFRNEYERNNWGLDIAMAVDKAIAHRVGWIKCYWDAHGDVGRGRVHLEPVSNYDLYLHDGARIRNGRLLSKHVIHRFDMSRNEILSKYGVDPEGKIGIGLGNRQGGYPANFALNYQNELGMGETTWIGQMGYFNESKRGPNTEKRKDTYEVLECWYMDDSRIETPEYDPRGMQVPNLLYPHGRIITVANQRLLYDGPNPFRFCPFVGFSTKLDVERVYGPSLVNHIAQPQHELNRRRSQISDHATLCSNPIGLVTAASGLDPDTVRTQPGMVHMSYDLEGFKWIDPPTLSPEVINGAQLAANDMDEISGMHEIQRGEEPQHVRSGTGLEKLREEGRTRTNLRSFFSDGGYRELTKNIISMFLDFVPDNRHFQYLNNKSMELEYGIFNPQELVIPTRRTRIAELQNAIAQAQMDLESVSVNDPRYEELVSVTSNIIASLKQEIRVTEEMPASDLVTLDVRVQSGTRSFTHAGKSALATQLLELGQITGYTAMKDMGYPDYLTAWKLKQEENKAAAEAAAQAAEDEHRREIEIIEAKAKADAQVASARGSDS